MEQNKTESELAALDVGALLLEVPGEKLIDYFLYKSANPPKDYMQQGRRAFNLRLENREGLWLARFMYLRDHEVFLNRQAISTIDGDRLYKDDDMQSMVSRTVVLRDGDVITAELSGTDPLRYRFLSSSSVQAWSEQNPGELDRFREEEKRKAEEEQERKAAIREEREKKAEEEKKRKAVRSIKRIAVLLLVFALIATLVVGIHNENKRRKQEVPYTISADAGQRVYLDILEIEPTHTLVTIIEGQSTASTERMFCKCRTVNGETVWISISPGDYSKVFTPVMRAKYFPSDHPLRIHGVVRYAESEADGLEWRIGQSTVVAFYSAEPAA